MSIIVSTEIIALAYAVGKLARAGVADVDAAVDVAMIKARASAASLQK
jgi:hypothetical protein